MENTLLYLSRREVEGVGVTMAEVITAVENMFMRKGLGEVEMPPKPGIHPRADSFLHAMPAYIKGDNEAAGLKWVGGYPANPAKNLPYITGLFILNDPATGLPLSVMDCTWITAMRTGAATAVAAKYLARPESSTLGIIGCGVQGKSNLLALNEVFTMRKVKVYDKFRTAAEMYRALMRQQTDLDIEVVNEPREAVSGLDLVVTAGPWTEKPQAVAQVDWLDEGAFASPVDMDAYWSVEAITQAEIFCIDDRGQFDNFTNQGYFQGFPRPNRDLGKIVAGLEPAREHPRQRIVGLNIGMALDDIAVAPLIYTKALEKGIGTSLPL